jgi:hypothetical protein
MFMVLLGDFEGCHEIRFESLLLSLQVCIYIYIYIYTYIAIDFAKDPLQLGVNCVLNLLFAKLWVCGDGLNILDFGNVNFILVSEIWF